MEDVTAIKIEDGSRGLYAFLTWGRVYDAVDPESLILALRRLLPTMGFLEVRHVSVCYDLGEVSDYRYFFEGLLRFAEKMAEQPYTNTQWLHEQRNDEALRRNVFLIGPPRSGK